MDSDTLTIAGVFSNGGLIQYRLPYFQREYTWRQEQWDDLLNDVWSVYDESRMGGSAIPEHFLGSIVAIPSEYVGPVPVMTLVDGQQRLLTISLLLRALSEACLSPGSSTAKHADDMLANRDEDGDVQFKIMPTEKKDDRDTYFALIGGSPVPADTRSNIPAAYSYIFDHMKSKMMNPDFDPVAYYNILTSSVRVIRIRIERSEKPYRIFESLNGKGKPLTSGDLVRNYVAMRVPETQQTVVFHSTWGKIDNALDEDRQVGRSGMGELTAFLRHYMAMDDGVLMDSRHIYARFRDRMEVHEELKDFIAELGNLSRYSSHYNRLLRPDDEPNEALRERFRRLALFDSSAAYPFLLRLYGEMADGKIAPETVADMVEILEDYLVRRYVCDLPSNYHTKQFPLLWDELDPSDLIGSLRISLGKRKCPTDEEFALGFLRSPLYDQSGSCRDRIIYILRRLGDQLTPGVTHNYIKSPTIEHVLPETPAKDWATDLGAELEEAHGRYLNTLANLTLVVQEGGSGNSSLGNSRFAEKRPKYLLTNLPLNVVYFSSAPERWGLREIEDRGKWLASLALQVWPPLPAPTLKTPSVPTALRIDSYESIVSSWRDITAGTARYIVDRGSFDRIREHYPDFFREDVLGTKWESAWRALPNGWRVYTNFSASGTRRFCRHLMEQAGLESAKWQVMMSDGQANGNDGENG